MFSSYLELVCLDLRWHRLRAVRLQFPGAPKEHVEQIAPRLELGRRAGYMDVLHDRNAALQLGPGVARGRRRRRCLQRGHLVRVRGALVVVVAAEIDDGAAAAVRAKRQRRMHWRRRLALAGQRALRRQIPAAVAAVLRQFAAVALQLRCTGGRCTVAVGLHAAAGMTLQGAGRVQAEEALDAAPHALVAVGEDEGRAEISQQDHEDGQLSGAGEVRGGEA